MVMEDPGRAEALAAVSGAARESREVSPPRALVGEAAGRPDPEVRAELVALLEADTSALGDVYRRTEAGESPVQIQAARGVEYPNFVYNYLTKVRALLDGELPAAPTVALGVARMFRGLLKRGVLSPRAREVVEANLVLLEWAGSNEEARNAEDHVAKAWTSEVEDRAIPGIYVYALPHYLRYPYDPDSDRTLLKVGQSNRSVIQRFRGQTRTTALPEDPVLLRIYQVEPDHASDRERQFHRLLEAADHARSEARTGGTEWFLTSLRFLDEIAATIGLESVSVYDPGAEPV